MLVLALVACVTGPSFDYARPTCQANYLGWGGGLTDYLDASSGKGDFDVDPYGDLVTRAFGNYELASGDFVYKLSYDAQHWRSETRVEGYGYAATNGDLDTEATWTTTDVLGSRDSVMLREQRTGCAMTTTQLDIYGREWVTEGRFVGNEFDYTRTGPLYDFSAPGEYTGVWKSDLSSEESVELSSDGVDYSESNTDDGDGNTVSDWTWDDGSTHQEGHDTTSIDGTYSSHIQSTGDQDCTIDYEVSYEGDGGGTLDCGSHGTCDLTYNNWVCTRDCSDGSSGNCWASNTSFAPSVPKLEKSPLPRRTPLR